MPMVHVHVGVNHVQGSIQRAPLPPTCISPSPLIKTCTNYFIPQIVSECNVEHNKFLGRMSPDPPRSCTNVWYMYMYIHLPPLLKILYATLMYTCNLLCIYVTVVIQINRKLHGRTAVHVACTEGYIGCLKLLLTYNPNLELIVRIS